MRVAKKNHMLNKTQGEGGNAEKGEGTNATHQTYGVALCGRKGLLFCPRLKIKRRPSWGKKSLRSLHWTGAQGLKKSNPIHFAKRKGGGYII